jgi:hypothetical protein
MEIFLKGNYKSFVKLDVTKASKRSSSVFIHVHGIYGLSGDAGSKSWLLGQRILQQNLGSVVQFSSSRNWLVYRDDWPTRIEAFRGKTFQQEADDLRDALDILLDQSNLLFGINPQTVKFTVIANSIGGTIISTLTDRFSCIERMIICASGTGRSFSDKPILSTCPPEKKVLEAASTFTGKVLFIQPSQDEIVPLRAQNKLFLAYKNALTKKIILHGANHNFSKIQEKNKEESQEIFVNTILNNIT